MSNYSTVPLKKVADFFSGGTPSKQDSSFWAGAIPWLTPKDMGQWNGVTEERVTESAIGNGTRLAPPGAIFIAVRGMSLHHEIRILRADEALTFNQDIKALVPKAGTDGRFLYYALLAKKSELLDSVEAAGHGTGRLPTDILEATGIPEVSPSYQASLGDFFGLIDEKINLNNRMNETLHAAAHALFEDWFVNFGPTQCKIEGGQPYLAKDLWDQFPARVDLDGLPEGWSIKPLDDIADFLNGLALQKFAPDGKETLPVIKIAELRQGVTSKSDRASLKVPTQYVIETGDVLFSWSGTLTHLVWTGGRGALNQHLFKVTSEAVPKWFFFYWISEHIAAFRAIAASKATTMGHIQRHHLHEALTIVPTPEFLLEADRVIGPLFDQAIQNSIESERLCQLRDLLLPSLFTGEIHLGAAPKMVGEMQ